MRDIFLCREGTYTEDPGECRSGVADRLRGDLRLRLSKLLAGILRHFPESYGVRVDERGWASIDELVTALRRAGYWWVSRWHVEAIGVLDPKGRYEVRDGRIRARYGHSINVSVEPLSYDAPPILYHGTLEDNLGSIMKNGILKMRRVKVHLTSSLEDAIETARRHGSRVAVLVVDTSCLRERGLVVARASKTVYVVDYVPPDCIKRVIRGVARG